MKRANNQTPPDLLPVLSAGSHRNPRRGACFMEFASYLAGERWSDHPACTHPLVASLARLVNDYTSDRARSRLVELIPCVIGLTTSDPRADAVVALRCATAALPVAPAERQRVLAVGVLSAERVLAELEGRPPTSLRLASREALERAPDALRWARDFVTLPGAAKTRTFRTHSAPTIVRLSVEGLAQSSVTDLDDRLRKLLEDAIHDCADAMAGSHQSTPASATPPAAATPVTRLASTLAAAKSLTSSSTRRMVS